MICIVCELDMDGTNKAEVVLSISVNRNTMQKIEIESLLV